MVFVLPDSGITGTSNTYLPPPPPIHTLIIGASDIYQANLKLILGLIWALILRYQIAGPSGDGPETKESKEAKKKRKTAKKLLLNWVNSAIPNKQVANFNTDWNDGLALSALVDYCKPGLIPNHASLDPSNGQENIKNAMDIAEKELGVPQVMHPDDMAVEKPDDLSVMTYVSAYCKQDSPGRNSLIDWINSKIPNQPVSNFSSDWTNGQAVAALTDSLTAGKYPDSEQMDHFDSFKNCQDSMAAAKELLGVEIIVPPEDFAETDLDDLTRMSYLTQFQHATLPTTPSLASTLKAVGHGITGDSAEKETSFFVRGPRIPKWAKLDVTVKGPDGEELPIKKQPQSGKAVSFFYTPETAGNYSIDIKLNNEVIPSSPFRVAHTPPTNVQGCHATGTGLSTSRVGDTAAFSVNCEQGGPGELQVEVEGPNGNVGTEIEETQPMNYSVNFTPLESGQHGVSVTWADKHIPNSPFQCTVTDPKRCTASGRGLTRASVNDPQTFNIKAEKAGPGELNVNIKGPNGSVPVETKDIGNGNFECTYLPKDKGAHEVDVQWSGAPIVGSPFKVNVTAPADASKCQVSNLPEGRLRANKTYSFNVDISEAGSGELTASAHGPTVPEDCNVSEEQTTCTVNFTPAEVGPIKVDVSYGNNPIPESPFQYTVNDPTKVKVNRAAIESGTYQLKQPIDFKVAAQYAGEGDLTASFKGPSGDEEIEAKSQSNNNYLLHICPEEGGPHVIGIKFDGDDIPGVPIRIFVEATSMADNVIVSQPMPSKIGAFLIEYPYPYKVNASGAGNGELTATSVGARTGTKPKLDISDLDNGQYAVTLITTTPDDYIINILWSEEAVPGSPFNLTVEDKPRPEKVITDGPHYQIGSLSPITLDVNTEKAGAGKLSATVYGNEVGSVPTEISDETDPRKYIVSFTPPKFDSYSISVLWSSENVTNSPFKINITPPDASKCVVTGPEVPADPTEGVELRVDATLAGNGNLTATAVGDTTGETDTIITETEPNKFNVSFIPALADYYTLDVLWGGERVPGSPFKVNGIAADAENVMICEPPTAMLEAGQAIGICFDTSKGGRGELTSIGRGNKIGEIPVSVRQRSVAKEKYDVRFTPLEPDVYVISVLWAGKNVKGSPFTINLMPVDVTKIRVIGPTISPSPKGPVEMMLQTSAAGKGKVTGTCSGKNVGDVKVAIKETSTDIYQLGFVPPQPDIYKLSVQYGGQVLVGSPFLINTLPSDAGLVIVTEPDTVALAESLHYKVDATNAGNGALFTICRGENYGQVQLDTLEESPALYDISFTPHHSDLYKITMEWDGKKVPRSPFQVDLRHPMANRVKVRELHIPQEAGTGEEVWVDLDCSDAGHGDIMAEARGNLVGKVPVTANKTSRGKYRVKFPPVQADIYNFSLAYGDEQIPGSPFYINLVPPQPNLVRFLGTFKPEGVSGPIELLFDIKDAGNGEMAADIAGDTCGVVPAKTEKPSPTQCKVSFVPKQQEMYSAAILWSKRSIVGSPFRVDARPTLHPELVVCGKPLYTDINKPVTLAMDIRMSGPGVVTGVCSSDEGDIVPVSVTKGASADLLTLAYVPPKHGIYNLSAFFEGEEVSGSPFTVNLKPISEVAEMHLMENVEEAIAIVVGLEESAPDTQEESTDLIELTAFIGEPLDVAIDVEDESQKNGELTASGYGDVTGPVTVQALKNEDGTFAVHFDPTTPDRYCLDVKLGGEHVPNSPIIISYLTPVIASKCRIFGLQEIPSVPQVQEPIHFGVDTREAGVAKLHVTSDGPSIEGEPSILDVKESDKDPGIYNITYLPTCVGQHRVHLLWGKDKIPGSPLSFEVGDVTQLQTFPFGKPVALDFAVDRKLGDLDAHAVHEENGKKTKVKVTKQSKGKFKLGFQPAEPGIYNVHVMVKKNEMAGSPFRIRVLPPPNPSGVKIEGLENGYVNQPVSFVVNARRAGGGDLSVRVSGPKEVAESDLQVTPGGKEGLFNVQCIPRVAGTHSFKISWAATPVPGSPFSVNVDELQPEIQKPLVAEATNLVVVGQPVDVRVSGVADSVKLSANCEGERSGDATVSVQREQDGSQIIHFVPTYADDFTLHILLGKADIEGSPFSIKAVEREVLTEDYNHPPGMTRNDVKAGEIVNLITPIQRSKVHATADGPYGLCPVDVNSELPGAVGLGFVPPLSGDYLLRGKANSDIPGSPFKIRAYGKDPDPNKVQIVDEDMAIFEKVLPFGRSAKFRISTVDAGPGTLNITSRGPGKADVKVFDNKDGTYSCEFSPSVAGKYHIDILWNDKHIKGSPYLLTFKSKKSRVITGLDLENENFRIDVPHRFKLHCDEVGEGILQITLTPSTAALVRLTPVPGGNSYQCEIIPKEVGNHQIFVLYNGKHILGSPFNVQFELRGDASKCRMIESSIENEQQNTDNVTFCISTEGAGRGKLTANVENTESKDRVPATIVQTSDDRYNIEFNPSDGEEYLLTVKYDEQHILGSPFKLVFGPPEVDASRCTAEGDGLVACIVDKWETFIVDTKEAGSGELNVAIEGEGDTSVEPKISPLTDTKLEVKYMASHPGEYKIFVTWGGQQIPNSPYAVTCYKQSDPNMFTVEDVVNEVYVGTPATFTVIAGNYPGEGDLAVIAQSSQLNKSVSGVVEKDSERKYLCTVDIPDASRYMMHVRWNGSHIRGSPFKVKVMNPPKPNLVKGYGPGLEDGVVGQEGNFTVETGEGGAGTLAVRVHGPKGAFKINMRRHPDNDRTILVRYDPNHAGKYTIDITWSDINIPGSPFTVIVNEQ